MPMQSMRTRVQALSIGLIGLVLAGCNTVAPYSNAAFNVKLQPPDPASPAASAPRHTFAVNGKRGNDKVLMFLALSGGGSRAAYLSSATMLALQTQLPADLLAEVDVISSVSGGSMAAAYYAASRDPVISDARLIALAQPLLALVPKLTQDAGGRLVCSAALTPTELALLRAALGPAAKDGDAIEQLCLSNTFPLWVERDVLDTMETDYLWLWFANWFWPANIGRYWFTSFDRSDIMAQTMGNNIYRRRGLLGGELTMADLNPTRPFLIVNATNASSQAHHRGEPDEFPFGSVFTFTREDFADRLQSDADAYLLARSVMGSSAFPLVFPSMTLEDFRPIPADVCPPGDPEPGCQRRFQHIFDGGNSDNLGLRSIKRALLQMEARNELKNYDRVLVLLVDAFTTPRGADRDRPDPRSLISLLIDTNVSDAVDSLLLANRDRLLAEFDDGVLNYSRDCGNTLRQLPGRLCQELMARDSPRLQSVQVSETAPPEQLLNLKDRLVFYHFGFEDVEEAFAGNRTDTRRLRLQLDRIPTSFKLAKEDAQLIEEAVRRVIQPGNRCLQAMVRLVQQEGAIAPGRVTAARRECENAETERMRAKVPAN